MICTKCKIDKTEEEFSFRNVDKNIRRTQCRKCHSDYRKGKYLENKEKELNQVKTYQKNNPEKYIKEKQKENSKKFVITDEGLVKPEHKSYSKKAGRTLESICKNPNCNNKVYLTNKEKEECFSRYCSWECRSVEFKSIYENYCSDVLKRCKGDCINNITPEYLKNLLEVVQKETCNITGIPIRIYGPNEKKNLYNSASLDRIDSSFGYIEGNVQWVCLGINYMKMNFSNEELIKTIDLIKKQI